MASEMATPTSCTTGTTASTIKSPPGQDLPDLSAADFRLYNKLAEMMEYYHNHFRRSWSMLHTATVKNERPAGMSIRQFLGTGLNFVRSISTHHGIEEAYVFPMLAEKMPKFREQAHLKKQHEAIHEGLDKFGEYLNQCASGERELRLSELGQIMNAFGKVLWEHLDDEVNELKANNMRKFWTVDEMRRLDF